MIHRDSENYDKAWRAAQDHWEKVVNKVLDTDAIDPGANSDLAMTQAVNVAAELLNPFVQQGYCPQCVAERSKQ
jgi:hypothetical protein